MSEELQAAWEQYKTAHNITNPTQRDFSRFLLDQYNAWRGISKQRAESGQ